MFWGCCGRFKRANGVSFDSFLHLISSSFKLSFFLFKFFDFLSSSGFDLDELSIRLEIVGRLLMSGDEDELDTEDNGDIEDVDDDEFDFKIKG